MLEMSKPASFLQIRYNVTVRAPPEVAGHVTLWYGSILVKHLEWSLVPKTSS